jgi:hypothetical protein
LCKAYADPSVSPAGEANVAKITSLAVKAGALLVILVLPAHFTLDLQLFGGLWILQTLATLFFGIYIGWFRAHGLIAGWVAGFSGGTWLAWVNNFKPLRTFYFGGAASRFIPACCRPEGTFPLQFSLAQCFGSPRAEIGEANYRRIVLRWASLEGGLWTRLHKHSPAAAASSAADRPG